MQNEIVAKLNRHLAADIRTEADVVYVLAEIRKLFEHARSTRKYPVLAFYSNWALHTKIDREPWAKAGLKILEDMVSGLQAGNGRPDAVVRAVDAVLSFQELHRQILSFGAEHAIAFDQLSNEQWRRFSVLLIDVLIDCPLRPEKAPGAVTGLSLSRNFVFEHAGGRTLAFWRIDLTDGRFMTGPIF